MQFKALLIFVVSQGKIFFYLISLQKADYIESMKTCRKVGERDADINNMFSCSLDRNTGMYRVHEKVFSREQQRIYDICHFNMRNDYNF